MAEFAIPTVTVIDTAAVVVTHTLAKTAVSNHIVVMLNVILYPCQISITQSSFVCTNN